MQKYKSSLYHIYIYIFIFLCHWHTHTFTFLYDYRCQYYQQKSYHIQYTAVFHSLAPSLQNISSEPFETDLLLVNLGQLWWTPCHFSALWLFRHGLMTSLKKGNENIQTIFLKLSITSRQYKCYYPKVFTGIDKKIESYFQNKYVKMFCRVQLDTTFEVKYWKMGVSMDTTWYNLILDCGQGIGLWQ